MMCIDCVFFFKQKTAYEMRISDWSSDVCSSDLDAPRMALARDPRDARGEVADAADGRQDPDFVARPDAAVGTEIARKGPGGSGDGRCTGGGRRVTIVAAAAQRGRQIVAVDMLAGRSEEHTSELQSLMSISYAVFCLKKKNQYSKQNT